MIDLGRRSAILETERLRLAPLTEAEAADLFALWDDPDLVAYWEVPEVDDPDVVAAIVRSQVAEIADRRAVYWSIRGLDGGEFIGCCELTQIDRRQKRAETGFMLGRRSRGEDDALEAMQAVISYAAATGLRRLQARTQLGARRSEAVLERLGFREEGLVRGQAMRDGQRRDGRLFGLLL